MNHTYLKPHGSVNRPNDFRILIILLVFLMVTAFTLVPTVAAAKPAQPGGGGKCKAEVCDGKDNDCDKQIDEGCSMYCDNDGDTYRSKVSTGTCSGTSCWSTGCSYTAGNDCNDSNPSIHPGATEICNNGIDENCSGSADETCVDPATCAELFPGTNVASADRINVVFVGMLFGSKEEFISYAQKAVDYSGTLSGTGLTELAVYKDNKDKFNFWYVDKILTPSSSTITSCTQCSSSETSLYCTGLANKYIVNFCNVDFRGCAYLGGTSYIATAGSYGGSGVPYVFDHEFQHQFPRLYDEYMEGTTGRPGSPNCAPDLATAQSWWGGLVGQRGADGRVVGYYDGCSYVTGNYRPTENSIMRSWIFDLGLVNERYVTSKLSAFSGTSSGAPSHAVEIVMTGDPSDATTYTVSDMRPVVTSNPVKLKNDKKDTVEIKVKDTVYSQNFETYEELITEDFTTGSSISLVDVKNIERPIVIVTVPTDNAVYNKATKKFDVGSEKGIPFTISIKKSNGQSKTIYSSE